MNFKQKLKIFLAFILIAAFFAGSYEIFFWFTHVYEKNARIQTNINDVSARVNGRLKRILVEEGDLINKGQLLAVLHHQDIELNIKSLRTKLSLKQAERSRLKTEKFALQRELSAKMDTQKIRIRSLKRESLAVESRLKLAKKNLFRVKRLVERKITPETLLTEEEGKLLTLEGEGILLEGRIAIANSELVQIRTAQDKLLIVDEEIKISKIEEMEIKDAIKKQELWLKYRFITSPIDGVVGHIIKFEGEYVEDGVNIMMLHDPKLVWVEAYIEESQLRHLRIGQDVVINLEARPFQDYHGKIKTIGHITTKKMGLDITLNNNRGFGNSAERVPVRMSIINPPSNLTPGMRATINVAIKDSLKFW